MNKSIVNIKQEFVDAKAIYEAQEYENTSAIEILFQRYEMDTRAGVQALIRKMEVYLKQIQAEKQRVYEMTAFEREYSQFQYICGVDEVGRGPFAGPIVAGAVILPKDCRILYLNDSKQLSEKKREFLYEEIMEKAVATGIGMVSPQEIDEFGLTRANQKAMTLAIENLKIQPDILLNDAVTLPGIDIKQVPIIKGDGKSISIAAASIIAKVTRDRLMVEYDKVLPGYGFAGNKGYGAKEHIEALKKMGATPIHRRSFIKNYI